MLILKLILQAALLWITIQDIKSRKVYWFLFPIVALCCAQLYYSSTFNEIFLVNVALNILFLMAFMMLIIVYSRLKLKKKLFEVIGLGDILLFIGLAFAFSTISFISIFISSLVFALVIHLSIENNSSKTVPLAGYMSLFIAITYISFWTGLIDQLYSI